MGDISNYSISPAAQIGAAGVGLAGSVISGGLNLLANRKSFEHQKELTDYQYKSYVNAMRAAGATPSSIIAGLGKGANGVPGASISNNPIPDLGSDFSQSMLSAAQSRLANSQSNLAQSEREMNVMRLRFEPAKYFADIQKSISEVYKNHAAGDLDKGMFQYYRELSEDIRNKRPWQIATLAQGLVKAAAEIDKIKVEKDTIGKQGKLYDSQSEYYGAAKENLWADTLNKNLDSFRIQFENSLRAAGWNPSSKPWDNILQMSFTNPKAAKLRLDDAIQTLQILDNKLKVGLGEHYKRNALIVGGLHYFNNRIGQFSDKSLDRIGKFERILLPILPSQPLSPMGFYPSNSSFAY